MTPREELVDGMTAAVWDGKEVYVRDVIRLEMSAVLDALTTGPLFDAMVKRALCAQEQP